MRCLIGAETEHLGALVKRCPPLGARHRSGSGNAITELGHGRFAQAPWPNWAVKLTRILPDFCGHSDLTEMSYGQNRP